MLVRLLALLSLGAPLCSATAIDNGIDSVPDVHCESNKIVLSVPTRKPFLGRIFAKGLSKEPGCYNEYLNDTLPVAEIALPLTACGMLRERKLQPEAGLMESVVIVVSFHYLFVTKQDQAFYVKCFYSQKKLVTKDTTFNISDITTVPLEVQHAVAPDCKYEVRLGSIDGPIARYVPVGEKLWHAWHCIGPEDMRMLVKSCSVFDGDRESFLVVDDRGCAVDPVVLADLTYAERGNAAWVESHAFKFADTNFVGFSCVIQLCSAASSDDECAEITPPVCTIEGYEQRGIVRGGSSNRRLADARSVDFRSDELDVSASSLSVFDADLDARRRLVLHASYDEHTPHAASAAGVRARPPTLARGEAAQAVVTDLCLSQATFASLVLSVVAVIVLMGVTSAILFMKLLKSQKNHLWSF